MDFLVDDDKTPSISEDTNNDGSLPVLQINPLTLMTSISSFIPVDDKQENKLESTCANTSQSQSSDLSEKYDRRNSRQPLAIIHMDDYSIAAWVKSTTTESKISPPIERSPSLPATIIEQIISRSRRNSTVSTLCDQLQQASVLSDTMSSTISQNASYSTDIQRSFSFPTADQHQYDKNNDMRLIEEQNDDDFSSQFYPVPESEDSEVDKKQKKVPAPYEPFELEARSPMEEKRKQSPSVSFHNSVSFDAQRKSAPHRRRNNSWNTNKNKPSLYLRSQSHKLATQSSLLHSQINNKQFLTSSSTPTGTHLHLDYKTNKSSSFSDNVFRSASTTDSPSSSNHLQLINNNPTPSQFLSMPSSASFLSSDRPTSNISDISGRSGIESSNVRTSTSETPYTASTNEEDTADVKTFFSLKQHRTSSVSTRSSRTATTDSLPTSSSEDDTNNFQKKLNALNKAGKAFQTPADQRVDVLRQLAWLIEKKPTTNPRSNLKRRKQPQGILSARSSFRSNNAPLHAESDLSIPSKTTSQLFSSSNENANQVHSLPINTYRHHSPSPSQAITPHVDSFSQSYTSVRSIHSDSSLNTPLINTKSLTQSATSGIISLTSSLHLQRPNTTNNNQCQRRRLPQHRRNLSGLAAVNRDRKNSFTKLNPNKIDEQQTLSQTSQQQTVPLVRDIKAILNEHLIMINNLLLNYSFNASIQYPLQTSSIRDFLYTRLNELSMRNPMKQRCSLVETKAFIDSITTYQMNRSHHYSFVIENVRDLLQSTNDPICLSTCSSETEEDIPEQEENVLLNSSPTRCELPEVKNDMKYFKDNPLRSFRTLSTDYIRDCEQTEKDLTQKLFDIADKQHILYCLKHVDSGHTNDLLAIFHRRLDAIFVWYNLYYELTISVKKLSGLLRCDDCDDWPKLHFRSLATNRERKAKRADESDYYTTSEDDSDEEGEDHDTKTTEESDVENEPEQTESGIGKTEDGDDTDIIPKICWPDEPLDQFSNLKISDESSQPTTSNSSAQKLDRTACYRNFVYYMDKRSYQVKYDGLARTLIERVAPVLLKTRLALLQTTNRRDIKIEQVLAGLSLSDFQLSDIDHTDSKTNQDIDDKLVDTDNPVKTDNITNINIGELTIEKWLHHVLKSCSTIKTICSHTDDILKQNWLELHEQLGLPSLLPLYFFIINVLLDVMNECLRLYNKPYMNNDIIEIDSLCRQQLVREAKLVLRDTLATRLYSVRMMEQFISSRKMAHELTEFDEKTVTLYMHYKQFLSTVSINRTYDIHDDSHRIAINERDTEYYYYVDEETSELIKEYYFARDLTLTLGNRDLIHALGFQFNDLVRGILAQLKEELYETTETYYQVFAADTSNASNTSDGNFHSADVISESTKPPYFHSSVSIPSDFAQTELSICDPAASFSEQKKFEIIYSTREFRRSFDTIKQRTIRICSLAKTLINDFSIAAEFKCHSYVDLWHDLRYHNYSQVKLHLNSSSSDDFDSFYLFVPPWLSTDKNQVEKLLHIICSQQLSADEINKDMKPSFMIFIPKKTSHLQHAHWAGDIVSIRASESTQLALNSTELTCLHLVVTRSDHWQSAVDLFQYHAGSNNNIQLIKKLARDEDIRLTFDQLPEFIDKLSSQLTHLVRILNAIWDQDSIKIFLTEIIKFDERQLRTIESKLLDLVLYVYNSGFELFRLLYELLPSILINDDKILRKFVSTMNEFFCEWCKCVTKKFKSTSIQQARTAKYKVLRPRWFSPGMIFLGFLAKSPHLQLLTEEEYKKLMTEMPVALKALRGNTLDNRDSPTMKVRSNSVSSTSTTPIRSRNRSNTGGHRRFNSGGGMNELLPFSFINPFERIQQSVKNRENELEQKLRERKHIGQIFDTHNITTTSGTTLDPVISLKTRNIDFPWRRGTRIGQGGAGVAFRAINCSNGSIVCMKEIQLSSIASRSLPSTYPEKLRRIAEEINMIMSINHPNIVRYFGIEKYKRTIYICMEYCLSTVNEFLNDIRAFQSRAHTRKSNSALWPDSSDQDDEINTDNVHLAPSLNVHVLVRGFVRQLLQALLALHEHCIVHCDVKGDNIFIANENGHYIVKLGDFNLSHRLELESRSTSDSDSRSTQFGTLYFKPPEPEYVYQSDIWALGCTIIEMLTGKLPWANAARPHEERIYIQNQLLAKKGPPIPDELKQQHEAYDFIQLCLTPDVNERPLTRALLDHPYPRVRTDP